MKFFGKLILWLFAIGVIFSLIAVIIVLRFSAPLLSLVPGAKVDSVQINFSPLSINLKNAAYTIDGHVFSLGEARLEGRFGSWERLRAKDPKAFNFRLDLKGALAEINLEEGGEASEPFLIEELPELLRLPFVAAVSFTNVTVKIPGYLPAITASGCVANSYEKKEHEIIFAATAETEGIKLFAEGSLEGDKLESTGRIKARGEALRLVPDKPSDLGFEDLDLEFNFSTRLQKQNHFEIPLAAPGARLDLALKLNGLHKAAEAEAKKIAASLSGVLPEELEKPAKIKLKISEADLKLAKRPQRISETNVAEEKPQAESKEASEPFDPEFLFSFPVEVEAEFGNVSLDLPSAKAQISGAVANAKRSLAGWFLAELNEGSKAKASLGLTENKLSFNCDVNLDEKVLHTLPLSNFGFALDKIKTNCGLEGYLNFKAENPLHYFTNGWVNFSLDVKNFANQYLDASNLVLSAEGLFESERPELKLNLVQGDLTLKAPALGNDIPEEVEAGTVEVNDILPHEEVAVTDEAEGEPEAVAEAATEAVAEKTAEPEVLDLLSYLHWPFSLQARVSDAIVRVPKYNLETKLSAFVANDFQLEANSLTGRVSCTLKRFAEESSFQGALGFSKGKIFINSDCDFGKELFSLFNPEAYGVFLERLQTKLKLEAAPDLEKLKAVKLEEIPEAFSDAKIFVKTEIPALTALEGKIEARECRLAVGATTKDFIKIHGNYQTLGAWFFHACKAGMKLDCGELILTNIAPRLLVLQKISATSYTIPSGLILSNLFLESMNGEIHGTLALESRKIKGQDDYLPYIDLDVQCDDFEAGIFCDLFNLQENRVDGKFTGKVHTIMFGRYVKLLDGKLRSSKRGFFTLKKADEYLVGMEEGIGKDLAGILAERLKNYVYKSASLELGYKNKVTSVIFDLDGESDNSHIKLPIYLHASWLDLLDLAKEFK